jgi:hypothetical protein
VNARAWAALGRGPGSERPERLDIYTARILATNYASTSSSQLD